MSLTPERVWRVSFSLFLSAPFTRSPFPRSCHFFPGLALAFFFHPPFHFLALHRHLSSHAQRSHIDRIKGSSDDTHRFFPGTNKGRLCFSRFLVPRKTVPSPRTPSIFPGNRFEYGPTNIQVSIDASFVALANSLDVGNVELCLPIAENKQRDRRIRMLTRGMK